MGALKTVRNSKLAGKPPLVGVLEKPLLRIAKRPQAKKARQ